MCLHIYWSMTILTSMSAHFVHQRFFFNLYSVTQITHNHNEKQNRNSLYVQMMIEIKRTRKHIACQNTFILFTVLSSVLFCLVMPLWSSTNLLTASESTKMSKYDSVSSIRSSLSVLYVFCFMIFMYFMLKQWMKRLV